MNIILLLTSMWCRLKAALEAGDIPVTHGGIVEIRPLDAEMGRNAGALLARTKKRNVIDAALVLLANEGDTIATSDPKDLMALARGTGQAMDLLEV